MNRGGLEGLEELFVFHIRLGQIEDHLTILYIQTIDCALKPITNFPCHVKEMFND